MKRYKRSAADTNFVDHLEDIRPIDILEQTVHHLFLNIIDQDKIENETRLSSKRNVAYSEIFDFIENRTRMIRLEYDTQKYNYSSSIAYSIIERESYQCNKIL